MTVGQTAVSTSHSEAAARVRVPWAKPHFGPEELDALVTTARSGWMSQGPRVAELEARVGQLTGSPFCVAVNNGTSALDIALKLLNIRPGDEVLVPAFAYIATVNSVLYQNATPVFVDIDPLTLNLDPADAARKLTTRTRALIAIDYGGHAADWDALAAWGRAHGVGLIEDAAPSFGGAWRGAACGTLADLGTTSFHTAKVFTTIEGGMVFCSTAEQAEHVKVIRSQGESLSEKYRHPRLGHNYRMSDLHAAIGLVQLGRYDDVLARRREAARYYSDGLADLSGVTLPVQSAEARHAWFLYAIRLPARDEVRSRLRQAGIETNVSWPFPAYAQEHLKRYFREPCRAAEEASGTVLCLPMYYTLGRAEQDEVIRALRSAVGRAR